MRKKEANPYCPNKSLEPPYLTQQQISDFYSQFTLFSKQASVKRIVEAASFQNYSKTDKTVHAFFEELKQRELSQQKKTDSYINFENYFESMINFFTFNNQNSEMMIEMLADSDSGEIGKEIIKEALEDSLGRKILSSELGVIMQQLRKDNFFTNKLKITKNLQQPQ